jgi:hypothetical protein
MGTKLECEVDVEGAVDMVDGEERGTKGTATCRKLRPSAVVA